jgi:hypothetical protein
MNFYSQTTWRELDASVNEFKLIRWSRFVAQLTPSVMMPSQVVVALPLARLRTPLREHLPE